ncbi:MAG: bifunctional diguanylate cyclase/phosphodiesterase [Gammaproteobacteria bacterium]|nr:bifunctional diguanylate cyclase/phosphodiesterase [Gammaproteobacteria bacterium]
MKRFKLNLLSGLVISIILLGIIAAATTIVTTRVYRDLSFDFKREHTARLLELKVQDVVAGLEAGALRFGEQLIADGEFQAALDSPDSARMSAELEQQLRRAALTDIVGLTVYNRDTGLLGSASRSSGAAGVICPELVHRARADKRPSGRAAGLCRSGDHTYQAVILPVAATAVSGHLQVVSDPVPALAAMEGTLALPVRLVSPTGDALHVSPGWNEAVSGNAVVSAYTLAAGDGTALLRVEAAGSVEALLFRLGQTNKRLIVVVIAITLLAVAIALWFVRYSVFMPLRELSSQLSRGRLVKGGQDAGAGTGAAGNAPASFHALGELYETLQDMAIRDPLTGTYNRALLEDRLKQLIVEQRRAPSMTAILLVDLVRFKYVNDLLGHHTGDLLLKQVVGRMADVLRESDTLARLGGDEFTVILPDTDSEQALQVAEKIIQSMGADFEVEGHKLSASVSIGIALMPDHGEDVETLLRNADYAMYTAKKRQPGCAVFDPNIVAEIKAARMTLDGALSHDLEGNDLFLVYQPVLDIKTGKISYLEALVRWRRPDGRLLLPDDFIRVAEQSGLIRQLTEWIIDTACTELVSLQQSSPGLRVGINLSMHILHDYNLADLIGAALARHRLGPRSLLLEITETEVMMDPEQVIEILEQLSGRGFELSIDDFGTGYSSLVYLKRLPVDTLKVDKSFVSDMDTDEDNASIVHATIDLAHNLGLSVTAEGVESRQVYERLREMGCDSYQGYYIGEPMDKTGIAVWLHEGREVLHGL